MKADGWGDDWSVGTLIDGVAAVALTFAIARYGLGALFGMLPWLLVRDRARRWPWGAFALLPWRSRWRSRLVWRTWAN